MGISHAYGRLCRNPRELQPGVSEPFVNKPTELHSYPPGFEDASLLRPGLAGGCQTSAVIRSSVREFHCTLQRFVKGSRVLVAATRGSCTQSGTPRTDGFDPTAAQLSSAEDPTWLSISNRKPYQDARDDAAYPPRNSLQQKPLDCYMP
jgi:hypothetical protein